MTSVGRRSCNALSGLCLVLLILLMGPNHGFAAELPRLGSEDPKLLWLAQQLGFPVQYTPVMGSTSDDALWARPVLFDVQYFITTIEQHANHWHTLATENGIGQGVFRLASAAHAEDWDALKLQLLALGCLAGDDVPALALWRSLIDGSIQVPDFARAYRYEGRAQ